MVWFRFHQTLRLLRSGQCTGANSTLNKGATGLPLRASAVVGREEGEGERRREETAFCTSRGDDAQREEKGKNFLVKESTRLFDSFTATPHVRLALRPTDGHAFICRRVLRSQQCQVPGTAKDSLFREASHKWLGVGKWSLRPCIRT